MLKLKNGANLCSCLLLLLCSLLIVLIISANHNNYPNAVLAYYDDELLAGYDQNTISLPLASQETQEDAATAYHQQPIATAANAAGNANHQYYLAPLDQALKELLVKRSQAELELGGAGGGDAGDDEDELSTLTNDQGADDQEGTLLSPAKNEIYLLEDKDYPRSVFEDYSGVGQASGITALPSGDVAIFHRSDRQWNDRTFAANKSVSDLATAQDNLIKNDTIMIIDRDDGTSVTSFGSNLFYMPHSVASDNLGNLWVSDVGRHQVMRLPTSTMQADHLEPNGKQTMRWILKKPGNMSRIWPDIILGEPFVPGNDQAHFCQPSEVAVSSDGRLVFVADGYCNNRVMVFTGTGKYLTSFGEQYKMNVVHSLALIEKRNLICIGDRENARILCFKAGLDGDLSSIGELMHTVDYPIGRVFALTAISLDHLLVSSNQVGTSRYDLAVLNPFSRELKLVWTSSDLLEPHSLTHTRDGHYAYVADLSKGAYKKVFKFNIIQRKN